MDEKLHDAILEAVRQETEGVREIKEGVQEAVVLLREIHMTLQSLEAKAP